MCISFVVPAFNEEALIGRCIQSIIQEVGTLTHEIIVVDNGSIDDTVEVARQAGAVVISEARKGVTRARQTGFEASKYGLVAFIDADSILPTNWLGFALAAFNDPNVGAVSGPVIYRELPWYKRVVTAAFYTIAKVAHLVSPMLQGGNFVLRRDALQCAGGFNTDIDFYGEDTDTAIRLSKVCKIVFDLDMWVYTSARRMTEEGLLVVGARYIANYVWMWVFGNPWSTEYHDHRPK
jgi:glycosyltransferase involved in cell wall biosynthesis